MNSKDLINLENEELNLKLNEIESNRNDDSESNYYSFLEKIESEVPEKDSQSNNARSKKSLINTNQYANKKKNSSTFLKTSDNLSTKKSSNGSKILSKNNSIINENDDNLSSSNIALNDESSNSIGNLNNIKIEKQINQLNSSQNEKVYTMNLNKFTNDKSYAAIHNKSKSMHESRDRINKLNVETNSTLDKSHTESNIIRNFKYDEDYIVNNEIKELNYKD